MANYQSAYTGAQIDAVVGTAILSTEQDLTDAQKEQARNNLGINDTHTTEQLIFSPATSAPDGTTFEFDYQSNWITNYFVARLSGDHGGTVTIECDPEQITQLEFIPYLLKNGVAYKYMTKNTLTSAGVTLPLTGEMTLTPYWIEPGTGVGFVPFAPPLKFKIPDDCEVLLCCRVTHVNENSVLPDTSDYSRLWSDANFIGPYFNSVVSADVVYKIDTIDSKLSKNQSETNRYMVTDNNGDVVPGHLNERSTALRPAWDTVIHRGWIYGACENTLPAFFLAKEKGYSWVECDVRLSSDGVPVVVHDPTITGTDADGNSVTLTVAETTLADLQAITLETHDRFGEIKMPTFAEFLEMVRFHGLKVEIDFKVEGEDAAKKIAQMVLRHGMSSNVVYAPDSIADAGYIAQIDKNASFSFPFGEEYPVAGTDFSEYAVYLNGANRVRIHPQANTWAFDEDVIAAINAAGLSLSFWNVTSATMASCVDAGAISITKRNDYDDVDLDAEYFATKTFW